MYQSSDLQKLTKQRWKESQKNDLAIREHRKRGISEQPIHCLTFSGSVPISNNEGNMYSYNWGPRREDVNWQGYKILNLDFLCCKWIF